MGILDRWEISITPKVIPDESTDSKESRFINKVGRKAVITDFAILLGGMTYDNPNSLNDRYGAYWTKEHNRNNINIVNGNGEIQGVNPNITHYGVRPFIEFNFRIHDNSRIDNILIYNCYMSDIVSKGYGDYPQTAPPNKIQMELEKAYKGRTLFKTNISFEVPKSFKEIEKDQKRNKNNIIKPDLAVYEYDEKLYVRVPVHFNVLLSNWVKYHKGDYVWIEVEPIKWYVSNKSDWCNYMVSKKILFAGVPYTQNNINPYNYQYLETKDGFSNLLSEYFELTPQIKEKWFYSWESEINKFIQNYWIKDIKKVQCMINSNEYNKRKQEWKINNEVKENEITDEKVENKNIKHMINDSVKEIQTIKVLRKVMNKK